MHRKNDNNIRFMWSMLIFATTVIMAVTFFLFFTLYYAN